MIRTLILCSCLFLIAGVNVRAQRSTRNLGIKADTVATDSVEYKLVVLDPGFDSWLINKPPVNYYSNDYYRIHNILYVTDWNIRYNDPLKYGNLYDSRIEYDPKIDYGVLFNYRLYYYFLFFQEKTGVKLSVPGR
jgi:hypothetical protein